MYSQWLLGSTEDKLNNKISDVKNYLFRKPTGVFIVATCLFAGGFYLLLIDASSARPWSGFATNVRTGQIEWWFNEHKSHSECKKHMYWQINNEPFNKEHYKEPYGCAFASNNYLDAVLRNELFAEKEYFECLAESKNPDAEKLKLKYSVVLNQRDKKQCVPNTSFDTVWIGRFAKISVAER